MTQCSKSLVSSLIFLPLFLLTLLLDSCFFNWCFLCHFFPATSLLCLLFPVSVACCSQSRPARLVVGPFWGWNCTGGRPSVHCNTNILWHYSPWKSQQLELTHCLQADWYFYLRWWGCVRVGYRLLCGPAGAAARSSGASELPREHPWCSHKPCSNLLEKRVVRKIIRLMILHPFCPSLKIMKSMKSVWCVKPQLLLQYVC